MEGEGGRSGQRLGDLLGGFLQEKGLARELERQGALAEWPGAVGEGISRVTKPRGVSGGTLVVEVRSSPWLMELNLMKGEILDRVNRHREGAPIEKLVFVLAETP